MRTRSTRHPLPSVQALRRLAVAEDAWMNAVRELDRHHSSRAEARHLLAVEELLRAHAVVDEWFVPD